MDQQFEEFLREEVNGGAFAASHHDAYHGGQPDLDRSLVLDNQTVVSEVTMLNFDLYPQRSLYQTLDELKDPSEGEVADLFNNTNPPPPATKVEKQNSRQLPEQKDRLPLPLRESKVRVDKEERCVKGVLPHQEDEKGETNQTRAIDATAIAQKSDLGPCNSPAGVLSSKSAKKASKHQEKELRHSTSLSHQSPVQPSTTLARQWLDSLEEEIQPMPTPVPRPPQPELQYDNRGRATKGSFTNKDYSGPVPGAFAQPGSGHLSSNDGNCIGCDVEAAGGAPAMSNGQETPVPSLGATVEVAKPSPARGSHMKWILMGIACLLLLPCLVLPIALLQSRSSEELPPPEHTGTTTGPMENINLTLVPNMTKATISAIGDKSSQQYLAYDWISEDPNWDTYEDWRKQQRFAMACFYKAFEPFSEAGSSFRLRVNYKFHECDWLTNAKVCGENGDVVKSLRILPSNNAVPFWGTMPPEIAFLTHLEAIDMSEVNVKNTEKILHEDMVHSFPPIKSLALNDCQMGGSIPSTLGVLTSLTSLGLSNNRLTSSIPSEVGLLSNLTYLDLSNNRLSGSLANELGGLQALTLFNTKDNTDLDPTLPQGFCTVDRAPFASIQTDSCFSQAECCAAG